MSKYLPPKILNHKKQGFTVPLNVWFKKDLNEYVNDRLISGNNRLNGYINKEYLIKLANGNSNGSRNFSGKIWPLLFLDAWLEKNNGVSGS
jgi:asparagine synthase (glutamine-hydrolysing)